MPYFRDIAPYLTHPLTLIGYALLLMFGVHRVLIKSRLLQPLSHTSSGSVLRLLLHYGFIIAVLLIVAGFGLQFFREARAIQPFVLSASTTQPATPPPSIATQKTAVIPRAAARSIQQHGNNNAANDGNDNFQNTGTITQTVAPCGLAIVGNKNVATVNCAPPSGTELAQFGSGTAVQIVRDANSSPVAIATGFWLNKNGYIATCLHSLSGNPIAAQVPMPPLLGQTLTVASGTITTGLQLIISDSDSDIAILHVLSSPFERSMHGMAFAQKLDDKGHPVGDPETTKEQYWVPAVADTLAHDGDEVIRVGFIQQDAMPVANYQFGHIVRMGVDTTSTKKSYRIFTSFQYKDSDCGAPIINNAKTVVGIMHGANGEGIPSTYIVELLKRAEVKE